MMKVLVMVGGIVAGALVQMMLPGWALFGGIKPPILLALALYHALHCEARGMWTAVALTVLLQDGLDLGSFGPALLAFPILGLLAQRVRFEIFIDGLVTQVVCGALGAMFAMFVCVLVYAINGQRPVHFGQALLRMAGSGLLGMATLPLVSVLMKTLEDSLPKRKRYGWQ